MTEPKKKKAEMVDSSITMTEDDLKSIIAQHVAEAMAKFSDGKEIATGMKAQMPVYPYTPKDGARIPNNMVAPIGWQTIEHANGIATLHPASDPDFNPLERKDVMSAVDDRWSVMNRPVAGEKIPEQPKRMLVNSRFQELFPNVNRWGDNCQVFLTDDATLKNEENGGPALGAPKSLAKFKFIR